MILDFEKLSSDERITRDEDVVFRDAAGEENRIRCHIDLNVRGAGETFHIHAELSGAFSTACHKCLESTSYNVAPSFDIVVQLADPHANSEPVPLGEDFVRLPAGQNRLALDQYIYENLVVDIPMKITCSDNCRGLCSGCGVNLNRETCRCRPVSEPGWNELRKIKDTSSD